MLRYSCNKRGGKSLHFQPWPHLINSYRLLASDGTAQTLSEHHPLLVFIAYKKVLLPPSSWADVLLGFYSCCRLSRRPRLCFKRRQTRPWYTLSTQDGDTRIHVPGSYTPSLKSPVNQNFTEVQVIESGQEAVCTSSSSLTDIMVFKKMYVQ